MKKWILTIVLLLGSFLLYCQNWEIMGQANFTNGSALYYKIDFSDLDTAFVAFQDVANSGGVSVMKYNGTSWEYVGDSSFTPEAPITNGISLAVDSSGFPYIAYTNDNTYKATVMGYNGTAWVPVGPIDFTAGLAGNPSLVIDSSDSLYLAYKDGSNQNKATVVKFDGLNWNPIGGAGFTSDEAEYTDMVLGVNDTLLLTFKDDANNGRASVMKFNGTNWEYVGLPGFSDGWAVNPSIAMHSSGKLYVAYTDPQHWHWLTVMKYEGGSWNVVDSAGFNNTQSFLPSMAVNQSGTPFVAYIDNNVDKPVVLKHDGNSWANVANPINMSGAFYTDLKFNNHDILHYALGGSNGSTVLRLCDSDTAIGVTSCGKYTVPSGNQVIYQSGSYSDVIPASSGCDSNIYIVLTMVLDNLTIGHVGDSALYSNASGVSYQWVNCDSSYQLINGANSQIFQPSTDGNYAVILSKDSCVDTTDCISFAVGIYEQNKNNITSIYPNPTTGKFVVRAKIQGDFTITDLRGSQVANGMLNQESDLGNQPKGIYLVHYDSSITKLLLVE